MRVLVVEDEPSLRRQLVNALTQAGYSVDAAADGEEGLYLAREHPYDLGVLDLGLPKIDGLEVIKRLRDEERRFPILVLTARGHWQDKVNGLEAGADDYLAKPFQMEELLARLNALLRRSAGLASATVNHGSLSLDTVSQTVLVSGQTLDLTAYEYKVIEYLMMHPGEVVSKTTLTEHIYAQDYDRDSNVIEVFVGRLRKKIEKINGDKPIETLRGRGYRLLSSMPSRDPRP